MWRNVNALEVPHWRFWTPEDGLTESWTASITHSPSDTILASHGQVKTMSRLNGWGDENNIFVTQIPNPAQGAKVCETESGQLWSIIPGALLNFDQLSGQWIRIEVPEIGMDWPWFPESGEPRLCDRF